MQSFFWLFYHVAAVNIKDWICGHLVKLLHCSSLIEVSVN